MLPVDGPRRLGFSLLAAAVLGGGGPVRAADAQEVLDARSAIYLRDRYLADMDTVHVKIMALANAIPADKYSWRPAEGVRSVSEVLMHVASEWLYYGPRSVGGTPPGDFGAPREALPKLEKDFTTKAQVLDQLAKGWAYYVAQMKAVDAAKLTGRYAPWNTTLAEAAFGMTGDQHEHLGQLIAYARSLGVKPPWST
jgi:uncharacterized damage-inducible protein DinB